PPRGRSAVLKCDRGPGTQHVRPNPAPPPPRTERSDRHQRAGSRLVRDWSDSLAATTPMVIGSSAAPSAPAALARAITADSLSRSISIVPRLDARLAIFAPRD